MNEPTQRKKMDRRQREVGKYDLTQRKIEQREPVVVAKIYRKYRLRDKGWECGNRYGWPTRKKEQAEMYGSSERQKYLLQQTKQIKKSMDQWLLENTK